MLTNLSTSGSGGGYASEGGSVYSSATSTGSLLTAGGDYYGIMKTPFLRGSRGANSSTSAGGTGQYGVVTVYIDRVKM